MLRPAVAATNCAKALETAGLNIADRTPVDGKTTGYGHARHDRSPKVPGREKAVNDGPSGGRGGTLGRAERGSGCAAQTCRVTQPVGRNSVSVFRQFTESVGAIRCAIAPYELRRSPQYVEFIIGAHSRDPLAIAPYGTMGTALRC